MKVRLKRKDFADAEGNVGRESTISGKISGLIVLEKFFEAARSTLEVVHAPKSDEDDIKWEPDASTVETCEVIRGYTSEDEEESNTDKEKVTYNGSYEGDKDEIEDIVLHIAFCDPVKSKNYMAEIVTLGSQTLADVRSSFRCLTEYVYEDKEPGNYSDELQASYFYIEGTFYIDQSNPLSRRCVESVKSWSESLRGVELSSFFRWPPTAFCDMGSVRIRSMGIRVNYPYLFSHGGVCNHTIYFRKVYFHNSRFHPRLPSCPFISYLSLSPNPKCCGCQQNLSSYITMNDTLAETDTSFWCEKCFGLFHFKDDGTPSHKYDKLCLSPRIKEFLVLETLYRGNF